MFSNCSKKKSLILHLGELDRSKRQKSRPKRPNLHFTNNLETVGRRAN